MSKTKILCCTKNNFVFHVNKKKLMLHKKSISFRQKQNGATLKKYFKYSKKLLIFPEQRAIIMSMIYVRIQTIYQLLVFSSKQYQQCLVYWKFQISELMEMLLFGRCLLKKLLKISTFSLKLLTSLLLTSTGI